MFRSALIRADSEELACHLYVLSDELKLAENLLLVAEGKAKSTKIWDGGSTDENNDPADVSLSNSILDFFVKNQKKLGLSTANQDKYLNILNQVSDLEKKLQLAKKNIAT
ncbi:MAG TPA: hypothetical protein VHA13_05760 [Gammaproteobacteria bacterium]|nr:hypothetical protein [Gammaproteobacteria bacterium]